MSARDLADPATGRARVAVLAAALLAVVFFAGTFLAPLLQTAGIAAGGVLRAAYRPLCHQIVERSLPIAAGHQAVCARCAGLYLGGIAGLVFALGGIARGAWRPRPRWLVLVLVPTVVDVLLSAAGLPSLSNVPRLLLAMPLGFVAALFLAVGIADLAARRRAAAPPTEVTTG